MMTAGRTNEDRSGQYDYASSLEACQLLDVYGRNQDELHVNLQSSRQDWLTHLDAACFDSQAAIWDACTDAGHSVDDS